LLICLTDFPSPSSNASIIFFIVGWETFVFFWIEDLVSPFLQSAMIFFRVFASIIFEYKRAWSYFIFFQFLSEWNVKETLKDL